MVELVLFIVVFDVVGNGWFLMVVWVGELFLIFVLIFVMLNMLLREFYVESIGISKLFIVLNFDVCSFEDFIIVW